MSSFVVPEALVESVNKTPCESPLPTALSAGSTVVINQNWYTAYREFGGFAPWGDWADDLAYSGGVLVPWGPSDVVEFYRRWFTLYGLMTVVIDNTWGSAHWGYTATCSIDADGVVSVSGFPSDIILGGPGYTAEAATTPTFSGTLNLCFGQYYEPIGTGLIGGAAEVSKTDSVFNGYVYNAPFDIYDAVVGAMVTLPAASYTTTITLSNPIDVIGTFVAEYGTLLGRSFAKTDANAGGGWITPLYAWGSNFAVSTTPPAPPTGHSWGDFIEQAGGYVSTKFMVRGPLASSHVVCGWEMNPWGLSKPGMMGQKGYAWHSYDAELYYWIGKCEEFWPYGGAVTVGTRVYRTCSFVSDGFIGKDKVIGYGADTTTGNVALPAPDAPSIPLATGPDGVPRTAVYYFAVIGMTAADWSAATGQAVT